MVHTAQFWRTSLLCSALVVLPSYVGFRASESFAAPQATQQAPQAQESGVKTTVVLDAQASKLPVAVTENAQGATIAIGAGLKEGDYKVERTSAPDKLIVDIFGKNANVTKSVPVEGSALISKVRVASHANKDRIVFDLKGAGAENVTLADGTLTVTLGTTKDAIQEALTQELAAKASTVAAVRIEVAPEGGNRVIADVSGRPEYSLEKTASSEYVLKIKGATLDTAASTTVLAPAASGSIRSVRPVAAGSDVLLRFFVAPEASVVAKRGAGSIIIASASPRQIAAEEMMAQVAPEAAKSDAKVEDKKTQGDTAKAPAAAEEVAPIDADKIALALDEGAKYTGRLISLDLQDTDIDNALRIIAEVSNLNIIASEDVKGKITLRLIDVPWDQALDVILKNNGLDKVQEGNVVRIAPVEKLRQEREALKQAIVAEQELEPLNVEYLRVSYAKASELKPLVESVLSERGSVVYDERTNQLIVKDIRMGLRNVSKLVSKLDLRTPQILLESQIVESSRGLLRDLGSSFDFDYRLTPATGNPTGFNFPNSVVLGGGGPTQGAASLFNAGVDAITGSSVQLALGSADGTKTVTSVLSALESEGRVRVISRPSVATTNNKQALIKAVETIRVKLPAGGLSVATGQGAAAGGGASAATESFEIGITLEVTPQASPDYYVLLDINAKSSTLGKERVDGIPSEVERSATSTVLVSSGQTFVMGGIYKIQEKNDNAGVPFLKDVPVIGALFRRLKTDNQDDEVIFFLTPRIIEGSFDDAAMRAAS
jgi:type IV pilus assembly protein PilQ